GRLGEPAARIFFRDLLGALRHAHGRGLLHCDVKPANVRLQEGAGADGSRAVLVDWGMAREVEAPPASVLHGTPAYSSPEQLTGYNSEHAWGRAKLGPPSDVWRVTLYELLAGCQPFPGGSREGLVAAVLSRNYSLPDHLSLEARQLIDAMLQLAPSDRASIAELCLDPWTTAEQPMPPEVGGGVVVGVGGVGAERRRRLCGAVGGSRRAGLYLLYGALVGGALLRYALYGEPAGR
ncbi:hypothetical protein EMIHUDRAFT_365796, partial [Emiliania huxleyi CCMP1516]